MKNSDRYSDIINLPHHQSAIRPRMSNYDRAAQFSPFAALKGYEEEIEEAQRTTQAKRELTDGQIAELNEKLLLLKGKKAEHPLIQIIYYVPDNQKQGGKYVTLRERLEILNERTQQLILVNGNKVDFDCIFHLELI